MTEATFYTQGAFCWAECSSSDTEGSMKFYGDLFGLDTNEIPLPPEAGGGSYFQFQKKGKNVAGLTPQQPQEREQGIAPHWNVYISVDDAEMKAKEAEQLGGTIIAPAFDVLNSGRMAVVMDPTGVAISFWQAKDHIGAEIYAEDGTITWWELMTPDPKRAIEFYTQLFGYGTQESKAADGSTYNVLVHKDEQAAGIFQPPQEGAPPSWTPYFATTDADATFEKAIGLGAKEMMPVTEIEGVGRFSWITDPQGAAIAFIQGEPGTPE